MHTCFSVIVSCIDFRIQPAVEAWARQNLAAKNYNRVALAGGVKDFSSVMNQIDLSCKLHGIKKVILTNHEDCGAYGSEATEEKHRRDLLSAAAAVKSKYPDLTVETYFIRLNGEFIPVLAPPAALDFFGPARSVLTSGPPFRPPSTRLIRLKFFRKLLMLSPSIFAKKIQEVLSSLETNWPYSLGIAGRIFLT